MFTLTDVRNIAVQIEQNGEETYRRAASQANDPELTRIFNWMADEEKHHGELFAAIIDNRTLTPEQEELETMGRSLLQDIVRSQTFSLDQQLLGQASSLEELLIQSIEFETDNPEGLPGRVTVSLEYGDSDRARKLKREILIPAAYREQG